MSTIDSLVTSGTYILFPAGPVAIALFIGLLVFVGFVVSVIYLGAKK